MNIPSDPNPYQSPAAATGGEQSESPRYSYFVFLATAFFVVLIAAWTVFAVFWQIDDHSWITLGIALAGGPAINSGITVAALATLGVPRLIRRDISIGPSMRLILCCALALTVATFVALFFIDINGC